MRFPKTFLALLCFLLLATTVTAQGDVFGTVYQTTNVRSGPDTRFEIVKQLSAGDRVQVDGRDADSRWLHILLSGGEGGWLPVFALVIDGSVADVPVIEEDKGTPSPSASVSVISYGRVNVRSGPGIEYDIVGQLDVNDQAEALARSNADNDWLMIRLGATEGWVAYFTVNVQGDPHALPLLVPDSSGTSLIPPSRLLRARFNVRLHEQPELGSSVIVIVPFDSQVTAIGRSAKGDWLFVGYNDQTGWGVTQLFDITRDELQKLSIYEGEPASP